MCSMENMGKLDIFLNDKFIKSLFKYMSQNFY